MFVCKRTWKIRFLLLITSSFFTFYGFGESNITSIITKILPKSKSTTSSQAKKDAVPRYNTIEQMRALGDLNDMKTFSEEGSDILFFANVIIKKHQDFDFLVDFMTFCDECTKSIQLMDELAFSDASKEDRLTALYFELCKLTAMLNDQHTFVKPPQTVINNYILMSCTVGDEVIYLNDALEDGATPESMDAKKNRFDFTHTIKTKPHAPIKREKEQPLYGEYNALQLDIRLNSLDDTYLVRITNEADQVVYEKTVNAGNIVALSIDISAYAKGRYTVTMENSGESFTGEFEMQTTGIETITNNKEEFRHTLYDLSGRRLEHAPQKGIYIRQGKKYVR